MLVLRRRKAASALLACAAVLVRPRAGAAQEVAPHPSVLGEGVQDVEVASGDAPEHATDWARVAWSALSARTLDVGPHLMRVRTPPATAAVELPVCAGRKHIWVDGTEVTAPVGPTVIALPDRGPEAHVVVLGLEVGRYEHRVACGFAPRLGVRTDTRSGIGVLTFPSPYDGNGGGHAVVYVPPGHDTTKPSVVLVGLHPWNGTMWTYAAYTELLDEARLRDVVLLMPSGLGNSLYTAAAEDEVLRAIDALGHAVAVDPLRVSIWGASMGGAGATTIGFHHPSRFASVTSFFGDSKYDLTTYVRAILRDERGAHLVNGADVASNAHALPVWLVHGEADKVSPIRQSEILSRALEGLGSPVHFDRVSGMGHEGPLVARFLRAVVDRAATTAAPGVTRHVVYTSVHVLDTEAYGVRIDRLRPTGDASIDIEMTDEGVRVHRAAGIQRVRLARGALGVSPTETPRILHDPGVTAEVSWDTLH